jgi:hypothetical protein
MLRDELTRMNQAIAKLETTEPAAGEPPNSTVEPADAGITRREFITGNLRPSDMADSQGKT